MNKTHDLYIYNKLKAYFLLFYDRSVKNEREAEILKNNQMNLSNYYHINYLEEKKK